MARKGLRALARARLRIAGVIEDWSVGVLNLLVSRRMKSPGREPAEGEQ
jgi:hypothetical protein